MEDVDWQKVYEQMQAFLKYGLETLWQDKSAEPSLGERILLYDPYLDHYFVGYYEGEGKVRDFNHEYATSIEADSLWLSLSSITPDNL